MTTYKCSSKSHEHPGFIQLHNTWWWSCVGFWMQRRKWRHPWKWRESSCPGVYRRWKTEGNFLLQMSIPDSRDQCWKASTLHRLRSVTEISKHDPPPDLSGCDGAISSEKQPITQLRKLVTTVFPVTDFMLQLDEKHQITKQSSCSVCWKSLCVGTGFIQLWRQTKLSKMIMFTLTQTNYYQIHIRIWGRIRFVLLMPRGNFWFWYKAPV